jgi:hypothetical protein
MSANTGGGGVTVAALEEIIDYATIAPALKDAIAMGGSTGAVAIELDGIPYIYKFAPPKNVVNEFVAFKLYAAAGARVPTVHLVVNEEAGGIPQGVLIQYIEGVTIKKALHEHLLKEGERITVYAAVKTDFMLHVLFANWDAINSENYILQLLDSGRYDVSEPYIIDLGGALFYRAMGEPKPDRFFTSLDLQELDTIPNESALGGAKLFVTPTMEDLREHHILHRNVCSRAIRLNQTALLAEVERLQGLRGGEIFGFYAAGEDLYRILKGRLSMIKDFCEGSTMRESIHRAMSKHENTVFVPKVLNSALTKTPKVNRIAKAYHTSILNAMKDEIYEPFRLRGARAMVEPGGITMEESKHIILTKKYGPVGGGAAGAAVGGAGTAVSYTYNWNGEAVEPAPNTLSDEDDYPPYPMPRVTLTLDGSPTALSLKHKMLASRTDERLHAWLAAQTAFIKGLTPRERSILMSYTRHGDRLVNNYLRRTLRANLEEIMTEILSGFMDYDDYQIPLAYSIIDQIDDLMRTKRYLLQVPEDWIPRLGSGSSKNAISKLLKLADGTVNMGHLTTFMIANRAFFNSARQIEGLIVQYLGDLLAIMRKAPPAPHRFTVFRGLGGDSYMRGLDFRSAEFLSTSLSPERVVESFLNQVSDERVVRQFAGGIYEMDVSPRVPCIYMESISQFPGEYEILLAPGAVVETGDKVYLKYYNPRPESLRQIREESGGVGFGTIVSVVECQVRMSAGAAEKVRQVAYLGDMRGVSERFSADKPRGVVAGKGRKKRIAWKTARRGRKGRGRHTSRRTNSS